jgi:hypothetical protein
MHAIAPMFDAVAHYSAHIADARQDVFAQIAPDSPILAHLQSP